MISESDLELLEEHLDAALAPAAAQALGRRLSAEPELAAALDELRSEHAAREAVWQTLEPDDAAVDAANARLRAALLRERVWRGRLRNLRFAGAAAACILLGFFAGWLGRGGATGSLPAANISPSPEQTLVAEVHNPPVLPAPGPADGQPNDPSHDVLISDQYGHAVQNVHFEDEQKADEFRNDLHQIGPPHPAAAGDGVQLINSEQPQQPEPHDF